MGKRLGWPSLLVGVLAACGQEVMAPGACPDFCPTRQIRLVDTVIVGAIVRDSSFRGYETSLRAPQMQVATGGGGGIASRGVLLFRRFAAMFSVGDTLLPVAVTDSFQLEVRLRARPPDVTGLELVLHRLPVTLDTLVSFDGIDPYFDDSTVVGVLAIPDTARNERLTLALPPDVFPGLEEDSLTVALGFSLRAPQPAFVTLGTVDGAQGAVLTRYVQIDSTGSGDLIERIEPRGVSLDTFVFPPQVSPDPEALAAGGVPSARALLRVALPAAIVDSSNVVRATLLLVPTEPVRGASGDSVIVAAEALSADLGPKSPIVPITIDTTRVGNSAVRVGSMDTVRIDVTHVVLPWRTDRNRPRSIMIRVRPEGGVVGELLFGSSRRIGTVPAMHVTYIPRAPLRGN